MEMDWVGETGQAMQLGHKGNTRACALLDP